ncbi:MAG: type II toxin-antitoxin system HicB family antitoxin [Planctomycetota bacterium]|nr:type II toxin-antitoxin system HicB family antitoxin [Planctomycetota bacterium]
MLKYKGYYGKAQYDPEAGLLHGEVLGLRDVVTFQGKSVAEIERAFKDSVDDYLDFCASRGESPEKPVTGKLPLRLNLATHRELAIYARLHNVSLNAAINELLDAALNERLSGQAARK